MAAVFNAAPPVATIVVLEAAGQTHVLAMWDELDAAQRAALVAQVDVRRHLSAIQICLIQSSESKSAMMRDIQQLQNHVFMCHDVFGVERQARRCALRFGPTPYTLTTGHVTACSDGSVNVLPQLSWFATTPGISADPQSFPVLLRLQSIDFSRLRRAIEASTRGAAAAGPPPRPVQGVASLRDLGDQQRSDLRRLGLRHIAEVFPRHDVDVT
jgi:hypothetical protein